MRGIAACLDDTLDNHQQLAIFFVLSSSAESIGGISSIDSDAVVVIPCVSVSRYGVTHNQVSAIVGNYSKAKRSAPSSLHVRRRKL
jgi:hypothetical protein